MSRNKKVRRSARVVRIPDALKGLVSLVFFLGIVGAIVLFASNSAPQSGSPYGWAKPRITFDGTAVSLQQARQTVSFQILAPTFFPRAVGYQSIRIGPYPDGWLVYLLYSPNPMPSNVTEDELFAAGGFFMVEVSEPKTDPNSVIAANVQAGLATAVTINGNPGMYGGNQVHWWAGGAHYAIVSPYSSNDMIAMANSSTS